MQLSIVIELSRICISTQFRTQFAVHKSENTFFFFPVYLNSGKLKKASRKNKNHKIQKTGSIFLFAEFQTWQETFPAVVELEVDKIENAAVVAGH